MVKFPEVIKDVKVPNDVKLDEVNVDGKIVSFLVKNCGLKHQ